MTQRLRLLAFAVALIVVAALGSRAGGSATAPAKEAVARGAVSYRIYCSNCHGRSGKGDGKLASELRQPPADLTQLANRHGGVFDAEAVRQAIDGRQEVAAHGEQDMPVWGLAFQHPEQTGDQEKEVAAKLDELVAYLETIQAPAPTKKP